LLTVVVSPFGIFRLSEEGTVTYANTAWHEMTGYPTGSLVIHWDEYVSDEYRNDIADFWDRVYNTDGPTFTAEWQFTNGRWVTVKIIRLDKAAPGLKGTLGCVTDITERKLHEDAQRQRVKEAEERRVAAEEAKRQQELLIDITSQVLSAEHRSEVS
jgi:PAS domain S-box-containing protein